MACQNTTPSIKRGNGIFDVNVVDPVWKCSDKLDGVHSLPDQMTGVEIEAEFFTMSQGFERTLRRVEVECNFCGVNLKGKLNTAFGEDVENRIESFRKQLKTGVNHFRGDRWERVIQVPDAGACKTVHNVDTKFLGSASGVLEFFNRPFVDPIRIAVSPNVLGKNRLMTFVDVIEDSLSYKVGADGVALEFVTVQQFPLLLDIVVICQCLVDFEMVAPACEFDSIVSEFMGHPCHGFDRQISPLASE